MSLHPEIPRSIELARGRKPFYRARCAWGNNHLRRRGSDGELMRVVSARSTAAGKTIATAIDGYRPHEDPLNPAYLSHWESTGRPLKGFQFANLLTSGWASEPIMGDDATDPDSTALASHTIAPNNNARDVWHDPNNRWQIMSNAIVRNGNPDYTTYTDLSVDEYDLHVPIYVDSAAAYDAGVLVRYRDSSNFICVRLHSNDSGRVDIYRVQGAYWTLLAGDTTWTISTGTKQMIVSVRKDRIKVFVDGVKYLDHATRYNALSTKVGLHAWNGCNPTFSSFYCYRPHQFYESFVDWTNWTRSIWGGATGYADTISGEWGKIALASSGAGTDAGMSGVLAYASLSKVPIARDGVFQFQIGKNKPTHTGARFSEAGIVISNSSSNDISSETNAVIVCIRNSGTQTPRIIFRKIVAGVSTDITYQELYSHEYGDNIRVVIGDGMLNIYTAKYGTKVGQAIAYLNDLIYVKAYVRTDDTQTVNGYFRDIGAFSSRHINIGGEVGIKDDFSTVWEDAYALFGSTSLTQGSVTPPGELVPDYFMTVAYPGAAAWAWAAIMQDLGDFVWKGTIIRRNAGNENCNLYFCAQEPAGDATQCYCVTFNSIATYLGKDTNTTGAGPLSVIATNSGITTATDEEFTFEIRKYGSKITVFKNDILIFNVTDATYSQGCFAFGGNDGSQLGVMDVIEHEIAPRGLQTPAFLRVDRHMVQNPSFEEWDGDDGLTECPDTAPNSWSVSTLASGTWSQGTDGSDGGHCAKLSLVDPSSAVNFQHEIWQQMIRVLNYHKYRVSFKYRVTNTGGGLIGGYPFIYFKCMNGATEITRHMIQIASPTENLVAFDEWLTAEFDFIPSYYWAAQDSNYIDLMVSTEYPSSATFKPTGDFDVEFDQVLIEDVSGFGLGEEPALEWTETPITFRGSPADRMWNDFNAVGLAYYTMPLNVIWRTGEDFTWGLLDRDYQDIFTSRTLTNVLPGSLWIMRPEWIACDLGVELKINQVLWYSLWSEGVRWLMLTYGVPNYSRHSHLRIMDGMTVFSSEQRLFLELEDEVETRYAQVVVLDSDEEWATVTAQQIELYNYADESEFISNQDGGSPEVSVTMTRPADKLNPLPDAATASVSLVNKEQRYNPYNKYSPAYGPYRHFDGLGDIRAGVPIMISMMMSEFVAGGGIRYAVRDECFGDQFWVSGGWLDNSLNPGYIRLTPPSSPPLPYKVVAGTVTINVDQYNKLEIGIEKAYLDNAPNAGPSFVWRLGVLVGDPASPLETIYFPDNTWRQPTAWPVGGVEVYNEQPSVDVLDLEDAGLTGEQTLTPFVEFDLVGGYPTAYSFYVMIDHYYLYQVYEDSEVDYETLMFMGTIGIDKNKGAALGVSIDGVAGTAALDAVDFSVALDQPVPVSDLNPLENISAEDALRSLCYLAGIPRQDLSFDATGITYAVIVFREQTIRENIQQLVQAIGGRFFASRDGRLRYQNVAVNRSWTVSDRQEFESGIKANVDTQSIPGEFWMDNVQWEINHRFGSKMPDQQPSYPWTVQNADSWRYLSNGDYVVITPANQTTKMQHIRYDSKYNKTNGFTLEYDVALVDQGGVFDVWGYVSGVAGYTTADCAWRVQIRKYYGSLYCLCGGQRQWWGQTAPLYYENFWAFPDLTDRVRVRIRFSGNNYYIYVNDYLHKTVPLCTPKLIRWYTYESVSSLEDAFGATGNLNGRSGDVNTTGDTWHDTSNRWRLDGYLHKNGTTEDWTTYIDFGCPDYWLTGDLYLDRSTAREGGWMLKYQDANNWIALRITSTPDPNDGWLIIVGFSVIARVGGSIRTLATFSNVYNCYEGSQHFALSVDSFSMSLYMSRYNPVWPYYTLWFQVGSCSFDYNSIGTALCGSQKVAPFFYGGANAGCSWDNLKMGVGYGYLMWNGPGYSGYQIPGDGVRSSSASPAFNKFSGEWHAAVTDTYSAKVVIGPDPATLAYLQNPSDYSGWSQVIGQTTGYRLGYFLQKFNAATAPLNTGYNGTLTSPIKDLTVDVAAWGIFEAEVSGIGAKRYGGCYELVSNVDFYVQTSDDKVTWTAWTKVNRGQVLSDTVELKRYLRWQARFWRSYQPWIDIGFPDFQYQRMNYFKAHVLSVTVNWQISVDSGGGWFRTTWNVIADNEEESQGIEMNAGQYSLGNPEANRVTAIVNRWVEQAITDVAVEAFWTSSELPTILNLNQQYVINAEYPYPSKKGSGGTLRHLHISVNSTPYTVNDGAGATACGNATVTFTSGQGVGVITIVANANSTSIDSAAIDAVSYMPASELYGTERVMLEDEDSQRMQGRVIETETFDNAFSSSRAIAEVYAEAELIRAKQYKETISGIQIPIMPSISLEDRGVVHNPIMGIYERQVEPMEITHQGFLTIITAEGVRTQEQGEVFDPLSLTPTGAWATHRMLNCASDYVMRLRSELTGDEFDVYDWHQWFPYYQLEEDGEWFDASIDDLRVITLYDQMNGGRDFTQATDANQPLLETLKTINGWPVVVFDGSDDVLQTSGAPVSDFFSASIGEFMVRARVDAEFHTVPWHYVIVDENTKLGIAFMRQGRVKNLGSFNNDGGTQATGDVIVNNEYHVFGWVHTGGNLYYYYDGATPTSVASGNTTDVTGELKLGNSELIRFTSALTFSSILTDEDRLLLVGWLQAN